ncbi:MAG: hypothetical protein KFW09_01835 [Oscillospiraceae bacterium]|nr:hypothetical protein [Oscillospiraceae bacterium]
MIFINLSTVIPLFASFSNLSFEESKSFSDLILSSIDYVFSISLPFSDNPTAIKILSYLSASISFSQYCHISFNQNSPNSIKFGDVSVSNSSNQTFLKAKKLEEYYFKLASRFLIDSDFVFENIGG